jgi:ferrochelatase
MKTAVVLFNLGGPDSLKAVRPFLKNLFSDKSIIGAPNPIRWMLAQYISLKRAPIAKEIYRKLGGKSPILPNTMAQAKALEAQLGPEFKAFIAMRYWHPFARDTAKAVAQYAPDRVILLPLYPQYSTTTNRSSFRQWETELSRAGCHAPSTTICCYPDEMGFINTVARLTEEAYRKAEKAGKPRVLFSAHGLPETIIAKGDPYQWQCERTAAAIVAAMGIRGLEWVNCYQSRVGPLQWIKPSTDDEIRRAGVDQRPVVVVPIAFVSEHSETLVELDIEYGELARHAKVPAYVRVPTVSADPEFIAGLARLVQQALAHDSPCLSLNGGRLCPDRYKKCPLKVNS